MSLAFWMTRLAGDVWPFAEKLNDPNHIRGPDGQAFPLPSNSACPISGYAKHPTCVARPSDSLATAAALIEASRGRPT
jgi:hypothetical protein